MLRFLLAHLTRTVLRLHRLACDSTCCSRPGLKQFACLIAAATLLCTAGCQSGKHTNDRTSRTIKIIIKT